jgi:hypothetical protein
MKIPFKLIMILVFFIMWMAQSQGFAQTQPRLKDKLTVKQAFESALTNMQTRLLQLPDNMALSYVEHEQDRHGNGKRSRYQPNSKSQGSWTTIEQYGETLKSSLQFDTPFLINASAFSPEQAQLVRETNATWVFVIPNLVNVSIEDENEISAQKTERDIDTQLQQKLQTELVIDKQTTQILSLHIFSKTPFSPSLLAKVKKFEVRIEFAEAWPNGPLISQKTTRSLEGSYGFFIKIKEFRSTDISDIKKVMLVNNS